MPSDYPLMPDENPPHVRRRIGASFKLDERLILRDKEVQKKSVIVKTKVSNHMFFFSKWAKF